MKYKLIPYKKVAQIFGEDRYTNYKLNYIMIEDKTACIVYRHKVDFFKAPNNHYVIKSFKISIEELKTVLSLDFTPLSAEFYHKHSSDFLCLSRFEPLDKSMDYLHIKDINLIDETDDVLLMKSEEEVEEFGDKVSLI